MKEPKDFPSFLYVSQVLQAEGIKRAIEAHRRKMDFCMGSLYWQINDCWPVASWSSIDSLGRWKALQYYAKKSFANVLLSLDQQGDTLEFHIVTDELKPVEGTLTWRLYDFEGNQLASDSAEVHVSANSAACVLTLSTKERVGAFDPNRIVLAAQLEQEGKVVAQAEHYFVYSKFLTLTDPAIRIEEAPGSAGSRFTLTAESLAKQVWIEAEEEGIFTDNFFDLIPGIPVTVEFRKRGADGKAFAPASPGGVNVRSMFDFTL